MADVADVVGTFVGLISGFLYPTGTSNPSVIAGVTGVRVYAGWPVPDQLDTDLANLVNKVVVPICHVSVYPRPGERNTTRYLETWQPVSLNTPTLTLTAAGQAVTVAGTIPPQNNPHNAVIFANGIPYVYAVQLADTLASIAAALATLINVAVPGTSSSGAIVTLPASARLGAVRIGVTGTSVMETARQEKQFSVIVWADSPGHRTAIAKVIDPALKALSFLALPDLSGGRIRYFGNVETDNAEKQGVYKRELIFTVEYGTFKTQVGTQVTQIGITVAVSPDASAVPDHTFTVYE